MIITGLREKAEMELQKLNHIRRKGECSTWERRACVHSKNRWEIRLVELLKKSTSGYYEGTLAENSVVDNMQNCISRNRA